MERKLSTVGGRDSGEGLEEVGGRQHGVQRWRRLGQPRREGDPQ